MEKLSRVRSRLIQMARRGEARPSVLEQKSDAAGLGRRLNELIAFDPEFVDELEEVGSSWLDEDGMSLVDAAHLACLQNRSPGISFDVAQWECLRAAVAERADLMELFANGLWATAFRLEENPDLPLCAYVDGAFDLKSRCGTYAAVIVGWAFEQRLVGRVASGYDSDSCHAELYAVLAALRWISEAGLAGVGVEIHLDNEACFRLLHSPVAEIPSWIRVEVRTEVFVSLHGFGGKIVPVKVKAHTANHTRHALANGEVDRLARSALREVLAKKGKPS